MYNETHKNEEPITLLCISNSMNPIGREGSMMTIDITVHLPLNDILCILGYIIILIFEIKYKNNVFLNRN